eukprot:TRINITY_DN95340_c0_g1_i1.p1 TRINITY_DN95340_c0_g1~~TRINITY_DN95340_c0_g1_i1.p1  ORF type:complete len:245 (-),score=39.07 TRINITY_DN95340_c0_g1_i1:147-881(-)
MALTRRVLFLRHGESECNVANVFSGWEDTPLTQKGRQQALEAGLYLKEKGIKFDVIFTSVLQRAVESVKIVCDALVHSSVPVIKSWRLNARLPGVLQGMTTEDAVTKYGQRDVHVWRSSYDVEPLHLSAHDQRHPANSPLYDDVPRKKLPAAESLALVAARLVPFWQEHIIPRVLAGESVLILGHKNSLKALFGYLEKTPTQDVLGLQDASASRPIAYEFDSGDLSFIRKYNLDVDNPRPAARL